MSFEDAFAYVVGVEGGLSMDPNDPGNWTGGAVNTGQLKGTKYGISAKAFPLEDIANLTAARAQMLAKAKYWDPLSCDSFPWGTALVLFDEVYNTGQREAVTCAQRALGLPVDGALGPQTLRALARAEPSFPTKFTAHRILAYAEMPGWPRYKDGWTMRAVTTLTKALS